MKHLFFFFFFTLSWVCNAQSPGNVDQTFGALVGFDFDVKAIAKQSDNKIIMGGSFSTYDGSTASKIIRFNTDGTRDNSFVTGTGFDSVVTTIAIQSDNKILVGGNFTSYNGTTANRIIRLNEDGSVDTTFITGTGFNSAVNVIAIQSDSQIVVGGSFTSYNSGASPDNRIIRLNTDGSEDTSFNTGTGFSSFVNTIAIQSDNKILVGGPFNTYNSLTAAFVTRLETNGDKDSSFTVNNTFNSVTKIVIQSNNKILIAHTNFGSSYGVKRFETNGDLDSSFQYLAANQIINDIALQSDNKIIVGGNFTTYNSLSAGYIARLLDDGSLDTSYATGAGLNGAVSDIFIDSNQEALIGGNFNLYKDESFDNRIIRLDATGTRLSSYTNTTSSTGFNAIVRSIAVQDNGNILLGGAFVNYKTSLAKRILSIQPDGSLDTSFNTGTGFDSLVGSMAKQSNGKILIGGGFTKYNGTTANRIIRLNTDGTVDTSFNSGTGFNGPVNCIVIQPDGKILVAGGFTNYNTTSANRIIRLEENGAIDSTFSIGTGFNDVVNSLVLQADNKIVVGGSFSTYHTTPTISFIRLETTGAIDTSFATTTGALFSDAFVTSIVIDKNGKLLLGGGFSYSNSSNAGPIIRLNIDGTIDTTLTIGTGINFVGTLAVQNDNKILVGGFFASYNGNTANNFIRLNNNGEYDTSFLTGSGFNNPPNIFYLVDDNKLLVGGSFTAYDGNSNSPYLIGLKINNTLPTDSFTTQNKIKLSPNPTSDFVTIDGLDTTILSADVFDLQGKMLRHTNHQKTIDVSLLPAGMYVLKINTEQGETIKKVVKM